MWGPSGTRVVWCAEVSRPGRGNADFPVNSPSPPALLWPLGRGVLALCSAPTGLLPMRPLLVLALAPPPTGPRRPEAALSSYSEILTKHIYSIRLKI